MSASPPIALHGTFRRGVLASMPITIGHFAVGISFGIAASRAGLSVFEAGFVSAVVYAGASQFLALALLTGGAPILVSAFSVIAMNLRHVLYGPAILEKAGPDAATRYSWGWGYGLADGVFGAALVALEQGKVRFTERWMAGIGIGPYLGWLFGTMIGAMVGTGPLDAYPAIDEALGFLMPALFLAMLISLFKPDHLPAILAAIAVTVAVSLSVSATAGIVAGMAAGALTGVTGIGQGRRQ